MSAHMTARPFPAAHHNAYSTALTDKETVALPMRQNLGSRAVPSVVLARSVELLGLSIRQVYRLSPVMARRQDYAGGGSARGCHEHQRLPITTHSYWPNGYCRSRRRGIRLDEQYAGGTPMQRRAAGHLLSKGQRVEPLHCLGTSPGTTVMKITRGLLDGNS